jgi:hypothetical protein
MNKKQNKIIFYRTESIKVEFEVHFEDETFWLTQKKMGELFGVEVNTVNYHLKEIFKSGELFEDSVIRKIRIPASDGKNYKTNFYNLDAIISVGYRVNSKEATQFRIWATATLKEFIIKGFVMDDERLKNGENFGKDYFEELLERIRTIRNSERRTYQKITDIFAECSIDYDKDSTITKNFYAHIQNKFHFAIVGNTAAEIIYEKADSDKPYMGLTSWKNSPEGRVLKSDVAIAKNYLNKKELDMLDRIISAYFDHIEFLAQKRESMSMLDLQNGINRFLEFNEFDVLNNFGSVSHKEALDKANKEYEVYKLKQDKNYISDFDREIKRLEGKR